MSHKCALVFPIDPPITDLHIKHHALFCLWDVDPREFPRCAAQHRESCWSWAAPAAMRVSPLSASAALTRVRTCGGKHRWGRDARQMSEESDSPDRPEVFHKEVKEVSWYFE